VLVGYSAVESCPGLEVAVCPASSLPPLLPTLGVPELLIILVIVLIFFGAGKLPAVGRSLGKGLRSFKKAQREVDSVLKGEVLPDPDPSVEDAVEVERDQADSRRQNRPPPGGRPGS